MEYPNAGFRRLKLKNNYCLFAVIQPTYSKCHLPKKIYGSFEEIIFFTLILDIFYLFLMSF